MLKSTYEWMLSLAAHRNAGHALFWIAFIESSVFPLPPDILLIAMVLADRGRAWTAAAICTAGSILGGIAGYAIGHFLFDAVASPILDFYGQMETFHRFSEVYNEWGWWIVFGAGFTPFPYKVVTIASGATGLDVVVFTIASAIGRGLRFFIVAALLWQFGPAIRDFIERYLGPLTFAFFAILLGAFAALRLIG